MSSTRHEAEWQELSGPTYFELGPRGTIDWHYHDVEQIVYPSSGVLAISAAAATWVVPPQRAVWIPAGVPHAHQAHGAVQVRTLAISSSSAVPARSGDELPALADPVPAAARAGAAGGRDAGDEHRAGVRVVEPERVY